MHRHPKDIAKDVRSDWRPIYPEAEQFLVAMERLDQIDDHYHPDSGVVVLAKFRWAARKWRGPVAKQIKSEIDLILMAC